MEIQAHAKINLYLDVLDRLPNGYHEIRSVMLSVSLADSVSIEPADRTEVICRERTDIEGTGNLAYRAYQAFSSLVPDVPPVRIEIRKRIPVAAGLAGGSADAAVTLTGLNELTGRPLDAERLAELGATIGADVPFCLVGGVMLAEGKGERLTGLPEPPDCEFVLVTPVFALSTANVYAALDELDLKPFGNAEAMISALENADLRAIGDSLGNRLFVAALYLEPELQGFIDALATTENLGVGLSGSGPTLFGLFEPGRAERAADEMRTAFPEAFVAVARPSQSRLV